MRDTHKELVIKTAIQEYKNSVLFGFSSSTAHAINMMEDAWHMCVAYNIKGIAELEKTIKEAKEKYKKELGNEEMIKDENMLENFIHAFRNKYDYDEIDEKDVSRN